MHFQKCITNLKDAVKKSPRYFPGLFILSLYKSKIYGAKSIADYYSVVLRKPMFGIKVLRILQGHFLGLR